MANQIKHNILFGLPAILILLMAIWTAIAAWSLILTIRPERTIAQLEANSDSFDYEESLVFISRLKSAIELNPRDANTHLTLAKYYAFITLHSSTNSIEKTKYQRLAEQTYIQAIKQQPTWDYAWARFAEFSNNSKNHKKLTLQALNQAMLMGPYELETQKILLPLIFEHWTLVNDMPTTRDQAEKILKQSLKFGTNALLVLDAAKQFNKLKEITPLVIHHGQKKQLNKYKQERAKTLTQIEDESE